MIEFVLYMRHGCHLCEDMYGELQQLPESGQFQVRLVDIDTDGVLQEKYGLKIPVLMAGEHEICHYTLDPATLREYLAQHA
jgi:hypothetical protein